MRKKKKYKTRNDTSTKKRKVGRRKIAKERRTKVAKTRGAGTLTEGEYFSRIRSALRRVFRWWPPMMLALKAAARPSQNPNKRIKVEYLCANCGTWRTRKEVEIDHIEECGSLNNYGDIVPFIQRLTKENAAAYQVLCKDTCHKDKTKAYLAAKKIKNN